MGSKIDERLVRMKFDNAKFEQGVSKTLSTIEKLKEKLKLKDAGKGFEDLQSAADKVSFDHLVTSVDNITNLLRTRTGIIGGIFDALGNKIVSVIDSATSKIQGMVNAVTFEPITTGFSEYETKINAIQVIAANTGALMQDTTNQIISQQEAINKAYDIWNTGKYGNGQDRKDALGDAYAQVQAQVNLLASGVKDLTAANEGANTSMDDIERTLDELNLYADKTIYNFTQMTQAIGTFTVAGVDLETSASAVKGIANLAAFVGAGASDASRIMFQLAQGLNTGYINLQDWMSLEHSQGFSGKVFQDELIDTAKHLREIGEEYEFDVEAEIAAEGSFRNSLKSGWLTTEVLVDTLHKFANDWDVEMWEQLGYTEDEINRIYQLGEVAEEAATKSKTFTQMWDATTEAAQSGWTETWQYIIGGFTEASELWTRVGAGLGEFIESFSLARNEALKFWSDASGRTGFIEGLFYIFEFLRDCINAVRDAWDEMFPPVTGKTLVKMSGEFRKFAYNLKECYPIVFTISNIFRTLFAVLKAGWVILKETSLFLFDIISEIFPQDSIYIIEEATGYISDLVVAFLDLEALPYRVADGLYILFGYLKELPSMIRDGIYYIDDLLYEYTGISVIDILASAIDKIKELIGITKENGITETFHEVASYASNINKEWTTIIKNKDLTFWEKIKKIFFDLLEKIKEVSSPIMQKGKGLLDSLFGGEFNIKKLAELGLVITEIKLLLDTLKTGKEIQGVGKGLSGFFTTLKEGSSEALESFKDTMDSIQESNNIRLIWSIVAALVALTVSLIALSAIDKEKLSVAASILTAMIGGLIGLLKTLKTVITAVPNNTIGQISIGLIAISFAVITLVGAIALIQFIDWEGLVKGLLSVWAMLEMLSRVMVSFAHTKRAKFALQSAIGVGVLASAVLVLVAAVYALQGLSVEQFGIAFLELFGLISSIEILSIGMAKSASIGGKNMALVAISMSTVLASIFAVLASLYILKRSGLQADDPVFLIFAGIVTFLVAVMAVMATIARIPTNPLTTGKKLLSMVGSAAIIVTVATYLLTALAILSKSLDDPTVKKMDELTNMLIKIIAVIGLVVAVVTAASSLGRQVVGRMTVLNAGVFKGIGTMLGGIGILILSLGTSILAFAESLKILLDLSERWGEDSGDKIVNMIKGICDAFVNSWDYVKEAMDSLKGKVGDKMVSDSEELTKTENHPIKDAVVNFVKFLLDVIVESTVYLLQQLTVLGYWLAYAVTELIIALLNGFAGTDLGHVFSDEWNDVLENMGKMAEINSDAPMNRLISAIVNIIVLTVYGVGDALYNASGPFATALLWLLVGIGSIIIELFKLIVGPLATSMLGELLNALLGEKINWGDYLGDFEENFKEGWKIFWEDMKTYFTEQWDRALTQSLTSAFGTLFGGLPGMIWGAVEGGNIFDSLKNTFTKTDAVKSDRSKGTYAETDVFKNFSKASNETDVYEEYKKMGAAIPTGVAAGIKEKKSEVQKAIENASEEAHIGFKTYNKIHSPSELYKEDAKQIPAGMAAGVEENSGEFTSSIADMIEKAKTEMGKLSMDGEMFDADGNFNTNIFANLKVDNINADELGITQLQETTDGQIIDIKGIMTGQTDTMNQQSETMSEQSASLAEHSTSLANISEKMDEMSGVLSKENGRFYDDKNIIQQLSNLRSDVGNLRSAINNVQMVLDTGVLVGELVGPMDRALGSRVAAARR